MTLSTNWLFLILAKAILELAAGGLSAPTREALQNIVDVSGEGNE
jgi:hypothetical protein